MDNSIQRLHRALVDALRNDRGNDFDQPVSVTVSEIYQKLLPYRVARSAVGFEMNADYEHALLRLLSGDGDLARVEPVEVREHLRSELESPNPNISLYRDYANCDVWVAPLHGETHFDNIPQSPNEFVTDDEVELAFEPEEPKPLARPSQASGPSQRTQNCANCGAELPKGRVVKFCPACGNDPTRRPCANCGEILDPMWRFCVNCGTPADE